MWKKWACGTPDMKARVLDVSSQAKCLCAIFAQLCGTSTALNLGLQLSQRCGCHRVLMSSSRRRYELTSVLISRVVGLVPSVPRTTPRTTLDSRASLHVR